MKDRIIQLLGNGVSPAIAASAVGCSESYISQLLSTEEVAAKVSAMRFDNLQSASNRDKKMDTIEDTLLDRLTESLPMMMRPSDILRAAAVVNNMKRRGAAAPEAMHIQNQVINLQLPNHATVRFQLSASREIVEVDGRSLVTMPSTQLLVEAKHHATSKLPREVNSVSEDKQAA